jgi:peptidoglycan/LPS O-acetylase OafA/YrhL
MLPQAVRSGGAGKSGGLYVPSLDGIRAASIMWVFVAHAGLKDRIPGNFGVTVFFFLSGYLITSLLRIEFDRTSAISFAAFYLRRALRLFPPFYLVFGCATLLAVIGVLQGPSLKPGALLAQFFYMSNYYVAQAGWWEGRAPGTWIYWSLAVEEHFYLAFPLFYLFLLRRLPSRRKQLFVLLGICAAVLAWRCVLVFGLHAAQRYTYVASDARIDSILFGCALGVFGNPMLDQSRFSDRWWKLVWVPLGLAGLLVSFAVRNVQFQESFRYTLQGLALFPLFIAAIRFPGWLLFPVLNFGWVRFIGVLSYSMYLLHPTVIYGVQEWTGWHPALQGGLALVLTLLIASGIHYLVEKPISRFRRRLSRIEGLPATGPALRAALPEPGESVELAQLPRPGGAPSP